jgi:hypothetical protein
MMVEVLVFPSLCVFLSLSKDQKKYPNMSGSGLPGSLGKSTTTPIARCPFLMVFPIDRNGPREGWNDPSALLATLP